MFTGIIRHVGTIVSASASPTGKRLRIDLGPLAKDLALGDSVAVNGTCLTVSALAGAIADFDVMSATLDATTAGDLSTASKVNLERALALGAGLDGHLVQGHVDGVATLARIDRDDGNQWVMHFTAPEALMSQMVPKGSIAIDGVSLTLVGVEANGFGVSLIPVTREETTLGALAIGHKVNIETDLIGKYVLKTLRGMIDGAGSAGGSVTLDTLRQAGFC
jgi:riboflavin synthase